MSASDKEALDAAIEKLETIEEGAEVNNTETNNSESDDFAISDENDYDIVQFKDGHIKTKNFDSSNVTLGDETKCDFAISSPQGINIAQFQNGHIKTKNFDSSKIYDFDVQIPEYYKSMMASIVDKIINQIEVLNNGFSDEFIFVTDTHVRNNAMVSPILIKYLLQKTNATKVFWGGDAIDAYTPDANYTPAMCKQYIIDEWRKQSDTFLKSVYGTIGQYYPIQGNHDLTIRIQGTTGSEEGKGYTFNEGYIRNQFMSRKSDKYVVCPSDASYYYFDNVSSKTRYVVCNGQDGGINDTPINDGNYPWGIDPAMGMTNTQVGWIKDNALLTLEDGWNLVVFCHEGFTKDTLSYWGYDNMLSELENLKAKTGDYSSVTVGSVVVICGHMHMDLQTYKSGILHFATCNDYCGNDYKKSIYMADAPTRELGTEYEQAFDFINVDWNNNIVHAIRIGAGYDRHFHLTPININKGDSVTLSSMFTNVRYDFYDCNLSTYANNQWTVSKTRGSIVGNVFAASNVGGEVIVAAIDTNNSNKEFFYIKIS